MPFQGQEVINAEGHRLDKPVSDLINIRAATTLPLWRHKVALRHRSSDHSTRHIRFTIRHQ